MRFAQIIDNIYINRLYTAYIIWHLTCQQLRATYETSTI